MLKDPDLDELDSELLNKWNAPETNSKCITENELLLNQEESFKKFPVCKTNPSETNSEIIKLHECAECFMNFDHLYLFTDHYTSVHKRIKSSINHINQHKSPNAHEKPKNNTVSFVNQVTSLTQDQIPAFCEQKFKL